MTGDILGPGTIFDPNNSGLNDFSVPPGYVDQERPPGSLHGHVGPGDNLLRVVIDTTGLTSGTWPLLLIGTAGGDTNSGGETLP